MKRFTAALSNLTRPWSDSSLHLFVYISTKKNHKSCKTESCDLEIIVNSVVILSLRLS